MATNAADLCVITSFFNPSHFKTKRENFERFSAALRAARVPLYAIELVFDDRRELPDPDCTLTISSGSVLWQKERLLNLLAAKIPRQFTKLAWVDCDVLFMNTAWARQASSALDEVVVVQLFEDAIRLPRGATDADGSTGPVHRGFAAAYVADPNCLALEKWSAHGHTGFAWAARRELFELAGLYDVCVGGSSDHLMAHAFCGDWRSRCVRHIIGEARYSEHYRRWSERAWALVQSSVAAIPGRLLHLWHGDIEDRRYFERNRELLSVGFDPTVDIELGDAGTWLWKSNRADLAKWAASYFSSRREDGYSEAPTAQTEGCRNNE